MTDSRTKLIFMGSPEFAVPTLETLIHSDRFIVECVVSQPDRPKGRGRKTTPTAVRQCALDHNLQTVQMSKENYVDIVEQLFPLEPVFIVVVAFGIIFRKDLLGLPAKGCINLHASLLPRHRGVSPIQAAILSGDEKAGCTTMFMDEGVDTGNVLLKGAVAIEPADTAGSLEKKLAELGAPLIEQTLQGLIDGSLVGEEQDVAQATYTKKIRKKHGRIDWTNSAVQIDRQVRAMSPWPTAYAHYRKKRLIALEAAAVEGSTASGQPGQVCSLSPLTIATGDGALELVTVKVEGKKAMPAESFVAGYRVKVGDRIE